MDFITNVFSYVKSFLFRDPLNDINCEDPKDDGFDFFIPNGQVDEENIYNIHFAT